MNKLLSKTMFDHLQKVTKFYGKTHTYQPRICDLAEYIGLTNSGAVEVLRKLENYGAIERSRNGTVKITYGDTAND